MRPRSAAAPRTPSVPLALGPIRWLNLSKAGALLLNIYLSAGNLNEIVIVIVISKSVKLFLTDGFQIRVPVTT